MRTILRTRWIIIAAIASSVAVITARESRMRGRESSMQQQNTRRVQSAAFRKGGLRAASAVTGSFETSVRYPSDGGPANVDELIVASSVIAIGSTADNVARPTSDGRSAITIYEVRVESLLKGESPKDGRISVIVLGGKVGFPDGSWARVDTPSFSRPTRPLRRLFFLHDAPKDFTAGNETHFAGGRGLVPTAGPLGLYDLTMSRGLFVQPAGNYTNPMAVSLRRAKLSPEEFLEHVRDGVHRERGGR